MKICFVHLGREHLGIEYISAVLKNRGHEFCLVCDSGTFSVQDNVFYIPALEKLFKCKTIVEDVLSLKPDLVAFSVYSSTFQWASGIAAKIRSCSNIPIVFGGIHADLVPEIVVQYDYLDYVLSGEGEIGMPALISALEGRIHFHEVPGLFYKDGDSICKGAPPSFLKNLDDLPFPDKELFSEIVDLSAGYIIMAGRGCPFSCTYCCESFVKKRSTYPGLRLRSVAHVIKELVYMKNKYAFRELMFFDSILFYDKEWTIELMNAYKEKIKVPFKCMGHVAFIDHDTVRSLKDAGCYNVSFGVQTFNLSIRKDVLERPETNEQICSAIKVCESVGMHYDIDLIFNIPGSSFSDYSMPLPFLRDAKYLGRIKCYNLSIFPGLKIADKALEMGCLSQESYEAVQRGITGNFFHETGELNLKKSISSLEERGIRSFYKVYNLLPVFLRPRVLTKRLVFLFSLVPGIVIVAFQICGAIKSGDYRFRVFIDYYLYKAKKIIFALKRRTRN